jgi:hypothetical protein
MPSQTGANEQETSYPVGTSDFVRTFRSGQNYKAALPKLATQYFGHRVTLTSATPILTANTTAQTTIYCTPFIHDKVAIYDGTYINVLSMAEQSLSLDTTNFLAGHLYDLFVAISGGNFVFGYGPAWTNLTTRSATLSTIAGIQSNNATITLRTNSSTTFSISANQASYVGTAYATANGQTGMAFSVTAVGGGASILGLFNQYNRVPMFVTSLDSTSSWTYATATWRCANGSTSNAVSFIDGLGVVYARAVYQVGTQPSAAATGVDIGVNLNSTSASPTISCAPLEGISVTVAGEETSYNSFLPTQGYNTLFAMEAADTAATQTLYGSGWSGVSTQTQRLTAELLL